MKHFTTIVVIWLLSNTCLASELTDATEILQKADSAALKIKTVTYDVTLDGIGPAKARLGKFDGTYTISGWYDYAPKIYRAKIIGTQPGSKKIHDFEAGSDGKNFFLVDHASKKVYEDTDPNVIGFSKHMIRVGLMPEFVHQTPFSDEINADKKELIGSKMINKEDCYEIRVVYAGGQGEARWCFSKKDFLPRSRIDLFKSPDGKEAGQRKIINRLVVEPRLSEHSFKLKKPKDYEKIDDFAP